MYAILLHNTVDHPLALCLDINTKAFNLEDKNGKPPINKLFRSCGTRARSSRVQSFRGRMQTEIAHFKAV